MIQFFKLCFYFTYLMNYLINSNIHINILHAVYILLCFLSALLFQTAMSPTFRAMPLLRPKQIHQVFGISSSEVYGSNKPEQCDIERGLSPLSGMRTTKISGCLSAPAVPDW